MPDSTSFAGARYSDHALDEVRRRGLDPEVVTSVLASPGQVYEVRAGRVVAQSLFREPGTGRSFLIRVFVDIDRNPPIVVTAYRSGKIAKYWSAQ